ncbi:hypothetical protein K2173_013715 [Erythroxylum novogranatense]|uniref:Uncharacterized protein n=1 Tax=Erythroxylum novogranatense TaxID=1862640 RepID=A0AAV8SAN7_9ROSI|nr:hypothetical protein K2173_013715 [Erythroxylum novogranatense]
MNVADGASRVSVIRVTLQGRHLGVEGTRAHNHSMMKMTVAHNTTAYRQDKGVGTGENRVSICKERMQDRNLGTKNSEGGLQSKTTNMGTGGVSKGGAHKKIGDEESSTFDEETDNTDVESADTKASDDPENEELAPKGYNRYTEAEVEVHEQTRVYVGSIKEVNPDKEGGQQQQNGVLKLYIVNGEALTGVRGSKACINSKDVGKSTTKATKRTEGKGPPKMANEDDMLECPRSK